MCQVKKIPPRRATGFRIYSIAPALSAPGPGRLSCIANLDSVRAALTKYVTIPVLTPAALLYVSFVPADVFGCVNRGLAALAITFASAAAAFLTVGFGLRARTKNEPSAWWLTSTLILTTPLG